eukprot:gnl/TRDRNA2_/TRDRNA2_81600_c0_seq1.p1 gnl/TRDRNA2_/TRDRNA2_81600_c0~~gnl/TRDRNA2_/TRDRNA2_81600_c0_seq1.p1  ORF type:complete len:507 (-),score=65.93 gnl/TRDRNA2_/TRDRNA2_81600_c0_seq1:98-1426(-)
MYEDVLVFERATCNDGLPSPWADARLSFDKDSGDMKLHAASSGALTGTWGLDDDGGAECDATAHVVRPGDRVHIKFAHSGLYLCDIPDYNGYAAVAGPAAAKATFEVELNPCHDKSLTKPAGARRRTFDPGEHFLQFKHLGDDDGREHKLAGWRYFYHATTSTGKYDKNRRDNGKQFFLINGTDRTVEYGKSFKLVDAAYFGITCFRMDDAVDTSIKLTGSSPQYWLSAKYASVIKKHQPMYHDDLIFESVLEPYASPEPSVQARRVVGNVSLRLVFGLIAKSGTELDLDETIRLEGAYESIRQEVTTYKAAAVQEKNGPITATVLLACGTSVSSIADRSGEAAARASELKAEQLIPGAVSRAYKTIAASLWVALVLFILMLAWCITSASWICAIFCPLPLVVLPLSTYYYSAILAEARVEQQIRSAGQTASRQELARLGYA